MHTYKEAFKASLDYFSGEELPANIVVGKYLLKDMQGNHLELTPDDKHRRIAKELGRIEKGKFKVPFTEEQIYGWLKNYGEIIPQGSPMYGIGNPNQYVTLSNCYVLESPLDSYGGIHHTDEQISQISKRRGGVGIDITHIRPEGMATKNSSHTTTGIIPFMERFSNSIREVGQNNRRGAMMITISCHHPQVVDFATVKKDKTKVTGANISIRLSNDFLNAVEVDGEYEQYWCDINGVKKYSKMVKARPIWDTIIQCAWEMAEPGLIFWDNVLSESPADCYSHFGFATVSTNPCSELPLCILDSCRLLILNLMKFINLPFTKDAWFDSSKFYQFAQYAQRLLDDIVDLELECINKIISKIESDPEPQYIKRTELELWQKVREKCVQGRRTGLGITALADCFAALGIKYGSDISMRMAETIFKTLKFGSYRSSCDMAKELGAFPIWDWKLEEKNPFINRIKDETCHFVYPSSSDDRNGTINYFTACSYKIPGKEIYDDIKKYGRRNIANLTLAPVGTTSNLAWVGHLSDNRNLYGTSSGMEPAFMLEYKRRKKITHDDKNARVDFVDQSGDKWQEFVVHHPALKVWMDVTGETDITKSPWYGCCAEDIDWKRRVELQALINKHIDHSISSTVNLPEDVTKDKVAEIYTTAWKSGCKGITVYRKNCRTGVLVDNVEEKKKKDCIDCNNAPKRPKILNCDVFHTTSGGQQFFVLVGMLNGKPYEVLAGKNDDLSHSARHGTVTKVKRGQYKLETDTKDIIESVTELSNNNEEAITRMVSTSLRHGADISFVVTQLSKTKGNLTNFAKSLARVLKKYIPDGKIISGVNCSECGSELVFENGCQQCKSCGNGKCG